MRLSTGVGYGYTEVRQRNIGKSVMSQIGVPQLTKRGLNREQKNEMC